MTDLVSQLVGALEGMLALDEENHQRYPGDEDVCKEVQAAQAALTAAKAGGWVVVPVEPTPKMLRAGHESISCVGSCGEASPPEVSDFSDVWTAMLAATPPHSPEGASMTTPQPAALPELPEPAHRGPTGTGAYFDSYTADQMRAYALATLQAQAQPAAVSDEQIRQLAIDTGLVYDTGNKLLTPYLDYIDLTRYVLTFARAILAMRPAQQATPEPVGEPALWVLTRQLEQRETTHRGYLWFSNPQNDLWTPLYTSPAPAVQAVPMTEAWLDSAMRLADAYADACFDQGLNQRAEDPNPEAKREKLAEHLRGITAQAKGGGA